MDMTWSMVGHHVIINATPPNVVLALSAWCTEYIGLRLSFLLRCRSEHTYFLYAKMSKYLFFDSHKF